MAEAMSIATEGSPNKNDPKWYRWFQKLNVGLNATGTIWIFVLMIIINVDIFSRGVFNRPIHGVFEMVEISIAAIVWLQLGHALKAERITRSDSFYGRLVKRIPKVAYMMGALFKLCGAILAFIVAYGTLPRVIDDYVNGHYLGNVGLFIAPTWPLKLIVVIGASVLCIQYLLSAWEDLNRARNPRKDSPNDSI